MFVFMCLCFLAQDDIFPISTHLHVNVLHFLHPFSVQGYLDCFQFLGIMNKAMNIIFKKCSGGRIGYHWGM